MNSTMMAVATKLLMKSLTDALEGHDMPGDMHKESFVKGVYMGTLTLTMITGAAHGKSLDVLVEEVRAKDTNENQIKLVELMAKLAGSIINTAEFKKAHEDAPASVDDIEPLMKGLLNAIEVMASDLTELRESQPERAFGVLASLAVIVKCVSLYVNVSFEEAMMLFEDQIPEDIRKALAHLNGKATAKMAAEGEPTVYVAPSHNR